MKHLTIAFLALSMLVSAPTLAQDPAALNDLEIAHLAYTADNIDIRYALLALALTNSPEVRKFAETMISDHEAANAAALKLLDKLGASAQDNFLSQTLTTNAEAIINDLAARRGEDFDRAYAANELAYHKAVKNLVEATFIPNIENAEVKALSSISGLPSHLPGVSKYRPMRM